MNIIRKLHLSGAVRTVTTIAAVMALSVGFFTGPASGSVSALGCHKVTNPAQLSYYWESQSTFGYYVGSTYTQTVPSSSGCNDINVSNVYDRSGNPTCDFFRVRFFPSSGGSYNNGWHQICSNNGTLVPIATNVANGTHYAVEYTGDPVNYMPAYYYNIWD